VKKQQRKDTRMENSDGTQQKREENSNGQTPDDTSSPLRNTLMFLGSMLAFLLLLTFVAGFIFNSIYSLLDPWDPLGLYSPNREGWVMGVRV
jgi:hypothetical protein